MMSRTRTNIRLDDTKLALIIRRYGLRTKTEAVEMAIDRLAGMPMTREEALAMEGRHAIESIPQDTRPRGEVRDGEIEQEDTGTG